MKSLSLQIEFHRVIKNGSENGEQHIMTSQEANVMKTYFTPYVKEMGTFTDEYEEVHKNAYAILTKGKFSLDYGFLAYPQRESLKAGVYLFKKEEVQYFYENGMKQEDYRTPLFKERVLDRFQEGKDFLYFSY